MSNNRPLTQKQENFCAAFIETGNQSEAYRRAYNADKMKPETVRKRASELLAQGDVSGMVKKLKEQAQQRHQLTVDDLLEELEEARQLAKNGEKPQCGAMVQATLGKAKMLGFLDKIMEATQQVIVISNPRKFD